MVNLIENDPKPVTVDRSKLREIPPPGPRKLYESHIKLARRSRQTSRRGTQNPWCNVEPNFYSQNLKKED
jgi:hypothetical protein